MQINPFGFPLGAGMQSAPALGGKGLGFADALGVAIEGGAPQLMGLTASAALPRTFDPKLARTLLEQARLDAQPATAAALPGLQQPTSLSELMATAAKLPSADAAPALEIAAPDASPAEATPQILLIAPQPAAETARTDTELQAEGDTLPDAPTPAPAEAAPTKPQKGPRNRAASADAEPAQPNAAQPVIPTEMLAAAVPAQPVPQPRPGPGEANTQNGTATPAVKKVTHAGAPATDASQTVSPTGTPDFTRAVAAKGESGGSDANADGQSQAEIKVAATAAKADAPASLLPHAAQSATGTTTTTPLHAAAPAEPIVEARAGHLGHALGVEIARKVELGEETLRIRLNPIELGRIEVTLAFDDKGSLQATVRTESAQAMDLLRQDASDLARTLDQAGVRTDAQSFRFENRGGDSSGQQAQQQQSQNRGQFASSDDDATVAEPVYRPVRSDGQVDLLA